MCWAIISSSLVGMTQTDTPLSEAEMRGPPDVFAYLSSFTPSHASLAHNAARTGAECSPMPAVNAKASSPPISCDHDTDQQNVLELHAPSTPRLCVMVCRSHSILAKQIPLLGAIAKR